jgi:hypothetical protein
MNEIKKEIGPRDDQSRRQLEEGLARIRKQLEDPDMDPAQRRIYERILAVHKRVVSLRLPAEFRDPEVAHILMEHYKT